jgi:hypothetical protein
MDTPSVRARSVFVIRNASRAWVNSCGITLLLTIPLLPFLDADPASTVFAIASHKSVLRRQRMTTPAVCAEPASPPRLTALDIHAARDRFEVSRVHAGQRLHLPLNHICDFTPYV